MKRSILILAFVVLSVAGCGKIQLGDGELRVNSFLPGECLSGTELSYANPGRDQMVETRDGEMIVTFGFGLDLAGSEKEKTSSRPMSSRYREFPSDKMFSSFGKSKKAVRDAFEGVYDSFASSWSGSDFSLVTILYNGGISLKADRDFAGFQPGEDLGPALRCAGIWSDYAEESGNDIVLTPFDSYNSADSIGHLLDIPLEYTSMLGTNVCFGFPAGDYAFTDEHVTFDLEIPVRVVMYLGWLNDKLSNPSAPVPYKDEVLHCRFTTPFGLR